MDCVGMRRRRQPTRRRSWSTGNGLVTFAEISQAHGDRVTADAVLMVVARMKGHERNVRVGLPT